MNERQTTPLTRDHIEEIYSLSSDLFDAAQALDTTRRAARDLAEAIPDDRRRIGLLTDRLARLELAIRPLAGDTVPPREFP
jgi:hypothetical protein